MGVGEKLKKRCIIFVATGLAVSLMISCSSVPKEIPQNANIEELKQKAYELTAKEQYAGAEKYYQTIIERYGMNAQVLISAEYEIAHLYVKQKKFNEAEPRVRKILNYYEVSDYSLPQQYRKLAELDMEKIENHKIKHELKKAEKANKKK